MPFYCPVDSIIMSSLLVGFHDLTLDRWIFYRYQRWKVLLYQQQYVKMKSIILCVFSLKREATHTCASTTFCATIVVALYTYAVGTSCSADFVESCCLL